MDKNREKPTLENLIDLCCFGIAQRKTISDLAINWLSVSWDIAPYKSIMRQITPEVFLSRNRFHENFEKRLDYICSKCPNNGTQWRKYEVA